MRRERRPVRTLLANRRDVLAMLAALVLAPGLALADPIGPVTKLPLPRFASLKTDRVNLREGPSKDHATKWVYERAGLPVEITAEFEIWRKVRDSEGVEGKYYVWPYEEIIAVAGDDLPIAIAVFIRLGGVTAKISSTSMIGGNAIITSRVRMMSSSVAPRR